MNILEIIEETENGLRELHMELFVRPSMVINKCNWCSQEDDGCPSEEDSTDAGIIGYHCEWTFGFNFMHAI